MITRRIVYLFICLLVSFQGYSQNISVSIAVPVQDHSLTSRYSQLLKNKLSVLVTEGGMSASDYSANIIIPSIIETGTSTIEGGMQNIVTCDIELTLNIYQLFSGKGFISKNFSSRGEGFSKEEATKDALKKILSKKHNLIGFFSDANARITDYYTNSLSDILTAAETFWAADSYTKAIALLYTYPQNLPDYKLVAKEQIRYFNLYKTKKCNEILQIAKGQLALENYEDAISIMNEIDMSSSCAKEVQQLTDEISQTIKKSVKWNWRKKEKKKEDRRDLNPKE